MNRENLINHLRGTVSDRKLAVKTILASSSFRTSVSTYIRNNSGDADDAQMILHDSIVAFVKYVFKNPDFQLQSSWEAYLMGMAKNLWITELRKRSRTLSTTTISESESEIGLEASSEKLLIKNENSDLLKEVLSRLALRCREVLMYWSGGYSMKEIASLLSYKSEGMARKKKSECMKELYTYLGANPTVKELIRSY